MSIINKIITLFSNIPKEIQNICVSIKLVYSIKFVFFFFMQTLVKINQVRECMASIKPMAFHATSITNTFKISFLLQILFLCIFIFTIFIFLGIMISKMPKYYYNYDNDQINSYGHVYNYVYAYDYHMTSHSL